MSVFKNTLAYYYYLTSFSNMHKTIIQVAEHISAVSILPEMLGNGTNSLQNNNTDSFAYLLSLVR